MLASLPAEHLQAGDTHGATPPSLWRDPQDQADVFQDEYGREWGAKHYEVESADGSTTQELTHPSQYLEVVEEQISTELSAAQSLHGPWIEACQQAYAELRRLRGPGSDPLSWAEFGFQVPVFERDPGFASCAAPSWLPGSQGPQARYKRRDRFLAPSDIADNGLVLVRTANGRGWSCYEVPPGLRKEVDNVVQRTLAGRALPDDADDPRASGLRAKLRRYKRRRGTLVPWHKLSEVRLSRLLTSLALIFDLEVLTPLSRWPNLTGP